MLNMLKRTILLLVVCALAVLCGAAAEEKAACTDIVILSTTDLHGKCWETNLLTGAAEKHNILRISTAVKEIREKYGKENVLLIDNGDVYQGTQVSEYQLLQRRLGQSDDPLVMALCQKEIGYTALVPGNHEFNYPWNLMQENYRWLQENGIPVLAANICRDGTEVGTKAGDSVFSPYLIREITVNGHAHKIGILGLENSDIPRWDLPDKYPGLQFVHPGNSDYSMTEEVNLFLPEMKAQGCEFIIVAYHGGLGETAGTPLVYGVNTSNQALRMIMESHDIDLMINGHDHIADYSSSLIANADGREIPLVNGGGQELTRIVFRFTEDGDGKLAWEVLESGNLDPGSFAVDEKLQELVRPYAEKAEYHITQPLGTAEGVWDENRQFLREQTDSMDLIAGACIAMTTRRIAEAAENTGEQELMAKAGTDHLDTDLFISNCKVAGNYVMHAGPVSLKDLYQLNRFSNLVLVIPMTGAQIRAVLEENAAEEFGVRVHDGEVFYYARGQQNTHLIFGGISYTCDMARPDGEKIVIEGFANGRSFDPDRTYLAAVTDYVLGNEGCGLRDFSVNDAIWKQTEERGEAIQNMIAEYITLQGRVTPEAFNWTWKNIFSGSPEDTVLPEEETAAALVSVPKDGQRVVIFSEAEQCAVTGQQVSGRLGTQAWEALGPTLKSPRPDAVLVFTVQAAENGMYRFRTPEGEWLVLAADGVTLSAEPEREELTWWTLEPAYGGWNIVNAEMTNRAIQVWKGLLEAYQPGEEDTFVFNFYEPVDEKTWIRKTGILRQQSPAEQRKETKRMLAENRTTFSADGLHASIRHAIPSPEWVRALPAARDENVNQLFIVAGFSMDSTSAAVSLHQRNESGEWMRILSTPGLTGKNGLCMDTDHTEGCAQTPIGTYRFNAAFGIAEDPGCAFPYLQVDDDIYWSGDFDHSYNKMVRLSETPDLNVENSERIIDYEYEYQYCLNISFNEEGTPGRGSAIFLHCLSPEKPYTGGCVAIPENIMKLVMQQVRPDCVVLIDTMESMNASF